MGAQQHKALKSVNVELKPKVKVTVVTEPGVDMEAFHEDLLKLYVAKRCLFLVEAWSKMKPSEGRSFYMTCIAEDHFWKERHHKDLLNHMKGKSLDEKLDLVDDLFNRWVKPYLLTS